MAQPKSHVEVRRSERRRRTVSAYQEGGRVIVLIPSWFTRAEEREWVDRMLNRIAARDLRRPQSDTDLLDRAQRLASRHIPELASGPKSVQWVSNQHTRWGSCTPADGSIRLSDRLRNMPGWVIDYVLLHELAHLVVPGHGADFWAILSRYSRTERARGYLEGVAAAADLHPTNTPAQEVPEPCVDMRSGSS